MKKNSPVMLLLVVSLLLITVFSAVWWRSVYSSPERVFQAMLANSLRLQSVTKTVEEQGDRQSSKQVMRLQFGAESLVSGRTWLVQQTPDGETVVETENVGTPSGDFVRYTRIETGQTKPSGEAYDFGRVLNIWGRTTADGQAGLALGELYNESVLGIIPFGVLDQTQRAELLRLIEKENVYEVDYTAVGKNIVNGRPHYAYQLTVDAEAYIKLLKRFGAMHGLQHLSQLEPADYAGQGRLPFTVTVDVWSRQLQRLDYGPQASAGGNRVETFTGHNGRYDLAVPSEAITVEELQARLQELQQ